MGVGSISGCHTQSFVCVVDGTVTRVCAVTPEGSWHPEQSCRRSTGTRKLCGKRRHVPNGGVRQIRGWDTGGEVIGGGGQGSVKVVGVVLPPGVEVLHPDGGMMFRMRRP